MTVATYPRAVVTPRGCGDGRQSAAIYSECGLGPNGQDVNAFIVCPPKLVDAATLGLASIGVKLIQRLDGSGVWDVWDIIGMGSGPIDGGGYWNVLDFIEEVARYGMSRRLPTNLDFAKLTRESRHVCLHRRGYLDNFAAFHERRPFVTNAQGQMEQHFECPRYRKGHEHVPAVEEMCAALWWETIEGGIAIDDPVTHLARRVKREMPSFTYSHSTEHDYRDTDGIKRRHGSPKDPPRFLARSPQVQAKHRLAIVAAFPITALTTIRSGDVAADADRLAKIAASQIAVFEEDR